jgi:CubicO group peptidase (beta-lactamase class C family)
MHHRFRVTRVGARLIAGALALSLVAVALATIAIPRLRGAHGPSAPDYWPTTGWRSSTPEAQGIDSDKLAEMVRAIREREVPVHSLLVIRHGYVVIDATFYPYDGHTVHDVASVTKSVMTTLIGIAADQGKLDLDDRMVSFFPDRTIANPDARKNKITIRHLVSMSSGLDCTREADELTNREMQASPDFVQFVLDREAVWEPGEHFVYCSPAIHLLSPILQQATGMTALAFAQQYLFQPLGIRAAMWEQDPQGYYDGWGDLSLHPHDMAKIGLLFMQRGRWEGKRVISSAWVGAATQAQLVTPDGSEDPYGYGWWMDPAVEHGYRADGRGGQYIFVLPEWDMIVVTTGGGFEMNDIAELILASFIDFEAPLPPNPEGVARLEAAIAAATEAPEPGPVAPLPDAARAISGKTYVLEPNPVQLDNLTVAFDGSAEAIFHAEANGRPVSSGPIGLDGVYRFSPGADGRPVAHRGTWIDTRTFALEYDGITNNDHSFFQFHFEGDRVVVRVQETARDPGTRFEGWQQAGTAQP